MLTQADAQDAVGADTGKSYALPPGGTVQEPLPLARLIFLEAADRVQWKPLVGAERFARIADDHYTQRFYWEAQQPLPATLFALRARLAQQVVMARLLRPWDADEFSASVDLAEAEIRNFGKDKL